MRVLLLVLVLALLLALAVAPGLGAYPGAQSVSTTISTNKTGSVWNHTIVSVCLAYDNSSGVSCTSWSNTTYYIRREYLYEVVVDSSRTRMILNGTSGKYSPEVDINISYVRNPLTDIFQSGTVADFNSGYRWCDNEFDSASCAVLNLSKFEELRDEINSIFFRPNPNAGRRSGRVKNINKTLGSLQSGSARDDVNATLVLNDTPSTDASGWFTGQYVIGNHSILVSVNSQPNWEGFERSNIDTTTNPGTVRLTTSGDGGASTTDFELRFNISRMFDNSWSNAALFVGLSNTSAGPVDTLHRYLVGVSIAARAVDSMNIRALENASGVVTIGTNVTAWSSAYNPRWIQVRRNGTTLNVTVFNGSDFATGQSASSIITVSDRNVSVVMVQVDRFTTLGGSGSQFVLWGGGVAAGDDGLSSTMNISGFNNSSMIGVWSPSGVNWTRVSNEASSNVCVNPVYHREIHTYNGVGAACGGPVTYLRGDSNSRMYIELTNDSGGGSTIDTPGFLTSPTNDTGAHSHANDGIQLLNITVNASTISAAATVSLNVSVSPDNGTHTVSANLTATANTTFNLTPQNLTGRHFRYNLSLRSDGTTNPQVDGVSLNYTYRPAGGLAVNRTWARLGNDTRGSSDYDDSESGAARLRLGLDNLSAASDGGLCFNGTLAQGNETAYCDFDWPYDDDGQNHTVYGMLEDQDTANNSTSLSVVVTTDNVRPFRMEFTGGENVSNYSYSGIWFNWNASDNASRITDVFLNVSSANGSRNITSTTNMSLWADSVGNFSPHRNLNQTWEGNDTWTAPFEGWFTLNLTSRDAVEFRNHSISRDVVYDRPPWLRSITCPATAELGETVNVTTHIVENFSVARTPTVIVRSGGANTTLASATLQDGTARDGNWSTSYAIPQVYGAYVFVARARDDTTQDTNTSSTCTTVVASSGTSVPEEEEARAVGGGGAGTPAEAIIEAAALPIGALRNATLARPILSFPGIDDFFFPPFQARWSKTFTAGGRSLEDCRVDLPFRCAIQPGSLEAQVSYEIGPRDPQNQTWQVSSVVRLFSPGGITPAEFPLKVTVINLRHPIWGAMVGVLLLGVVAWVWVRGRRRVRENIFGGRR